MSRSKAKNYKILRRRKKGQNLHKTGFGNYFLDTAPKAQATEFLKIDKLYSKRKFNSKKKKSMHREKILANHMRLTSRIHRELLTQQKTQITHLRNGQRP